jgi:hypothetical protein
MDVTREAIWGDPRLAYAYLLISRIADTLTEDSPEEDAVRLAMSKLDEADMILKGIEITHA